MNLVASDQYDRISMHIWPPLIDSDILFPRRLLHPQFQTKAVHEIWDMYLKSSHGGPVMGASVLTTIQQKSVISVDQTASTAFSLVYFTFPWSGLARESPPIRFLFFHFLFCIDGNTITT
jgi:hypothetical protein